LSKWIAISATVKMFITWQWEGISIFS